MPPPPPHSSPKFAIPFVYYLLAIVATAALSLVIYNLFIVRWCASYAPPRTTERTEPQSEPSSSQSFDNPNIRLVSSFKYRREQKIGQEHNEGEYECAICLSVFEEGEEVRQMPRCKHSFHAPCIDMWLSSHANCPVCRAPLGSQIFQRNLPIGQADNSREGFLYSNMMV